jgi:hypothetical protein
MKGYHVYTQSEESKYYDPIDDIVLLLSIISWKKYFGPIHLYCNQKYLDRISKWGLHLEYSNIDTNELENNIPFKKYLNEYFAFSKIYITKLLSEKNEPFTIVDTDLWINSPFSIPNVDMLFNHDEIVTSHEDHYPNGYIYPKYFLNEDDDDLNMFNHVSNPINASINFYISNFQNPINDWYDFVIKVINRNKDIKNEIGRNAKMLFIEQQAFPKFLEKHNTNFDFILHSSYLANSYSGLSGDGKEWQPSITLRPTEAGLIKHIWGLKHYYNNQYIRKVIIELILNSLQSYPPEIHKKYNSLISTVKNLI